MNATFLSYSAVTYVAEEVYEDDDVLRNALHNFHDMEEEYEKDAAYSPFRDDEHENVTELSQQFDG